MPCESTLIADLQCTYRVAAQNKPPNQKCQQCYRGLPLDVSGWYLGPVMSDVISHGVVFFFHSSTTH